jgi:hypothetical protein
MKQARAQKLLFTPFNYSGVSCPAKNTNKKVEEDDILFDNLTPLFSLGSNKNTNSRLPKSSKTFGLINPGDYCKVAQTVVGNITNTKLISTIQINFRDFDDSSAKNSSHHSQEMGYLVYQFVGAATIGGINETVVCQMRRESTKSCADINKKLVRDIKRGTPMLKSGKRVIPYDIVYENLSTHSKQQWLDPLEPYRSSYIHEETGKLHLVSKELIVGKSHYCQTIETQYLLSVLSGSISPPTCRPPRSYNKRGVPISNNWSCPM